jgi:hypothetical protein
MCRSPFSGAIFDKYSNFLTNSLARSFSEHLVSKRRATLHSSLYLAFA